jgi:hypothetical protein
MLIFGILFRQWFTKYENGSRGQNSDNKLKTLSCIFLSGIGAHEEHVKLSKFHLLEKPAVPVHTMRCAVSGLL